MLRLALALSLISTPVLAEAPRVAVDIAPVHSIVARVMQGVGEPDLILPPNASPHGYALRPSEARAVAGAELFIWVGPELTPWLEDAIKTLAPDGDRLTLMDVDGIKVLPFRQKVSLDLGDDGHDHDHGHEEKHDEEEEHAHEDEHEDEHAHEHEDAHEDEHAHDEDHDHKDEHAHDEDHDHGAEHAHDDDHEAEHDHEEGHDHADHHGQNDPHAWLSPSNGAVWALAVAEKLAERDPEHAETYRQNAASLVQELDAFQSVWRAMFDPVHDTSFVVLHDALQYFEASFDLHPPLAVSTGDAATPGAARISTLREAIVEGNVACAFSEPQLNTSLLEQVIEGTEIKQAEVDVIGASHTPGPDHYVQTLTALASTIQGCLSK